MKNITPAMAKALVELLEIIDSNSDKYPDWINAVCTAAETLPPGTAEALATEASVLAASSTVGQSA